MGVLGPRLSPTDPIISDWFRHKVDYCELSGSPTVDAGRQDRYHGVRLFIVIFTNADFTPDSNFPAAATQSNQDSLLFVLPHKRAERLSDSKQLGKYDQGAFQPFYIGPL